MGVFAFILRGLISQYKTVFSKNLQAVSRNLADTSIAAYFRSFRALFNKAISEGIVKKDYYPFDEFKIAKFKTRTQKRSINKEDVIKIIALDLVDLSVGYAIIALTIVKYIHV
jgi:hypothetical protein